MEITSTSAAAWRRDQYAMTAEDAIPEALIVATTTKAGVIEGDAPVIHVGFITDDEAQFIAEGDTIPESDPDLAEVAVATGKVAQLVRLSREQWAQEKAAGSIGASVRRAITKKANLAFLTQTAPIAPKVAPSTGLLNVAGLVDGGAVAADLDALVDLIATLEQNDASPSHIILDPVGWASLRKFKTRTDSAESLLGAGTTDAPRILLDVPVLVTPAMPAGTGLVIDKTAIASAYGDLQVATSEEAFFAQDSIAVRATFRLGQTVVHPDRIGKFTVTAPVA